MRVLITGAGGPAAVSIWKSLKDDHQLFLADMDPSAPGLYLTAAGQRFVIPAGDSPQLVDALLQLCKAQRIEVLLTTVDAELAPIAARSAEFNAIGVQVPLSPHATLQMCRDKYLLLKHLQGAAPVPEFVLLSPRTQAEISAFPRFAKPRLGAGSRGIKLIENAAALNELPLDDSYLVQELLPGVEFSVDVYVTSQGQVIAAVPRERIRTDSGIAITARTLHHAELIAAAIAVAKAADIRYVANIQFKQAADGVFKLLEINPRFPGSLPLTAAAGVDIPKLLMADIQGQPLPSELIEFQDLLMVRYWTEHYLDPSEWEALCRQ